MVWVGADILSQQRCVLLGPALNAYRVIIFQYDRLLQDKSMAVISGADDEGWDHRDLRPRSYY
jgi:hypothetical protein